MSVCACAASHIIFTSDGNVATMPHKIPTNTQAFNWNGCPNMYAFPPNTQVEAIKTFKQNPTSPIPLETPHISVYSLSVYACTGQGWIQLSTLVSEMGLTNGGGQSILGTSAASPGIKHATYWVVPSACVYVADVFGYRSSVLASVGKWGLTCGSPGHCPKSQLIYKTYQKSRC